MPLRLLRLLRDLPARLRHQAELRRHSLLLPDPPSAGPLVHLGGVLDHPPLIGGKVKLLPLRDTFPCADPARANLLYLVSSAPPAFASDLLAWTARRRIPLVWNQNGVAYPAWAGHSTSSINRPMSRLRRQAVHIVNQSQFCRDSADLFLGPLPPSVIQETLFNPVDLAAFAPPETPVSPDPWRLLALGTHGYPERVLHVLDALALLLHEHCLPVTLTLAGKLNWPGAEAHVRLRAEKLRLRPGRDFTLLPAFTQAEAREIYRSHHLLLHPKYLDPCPTVVIEALASGLPVVASASGGLPEMVPPACGHLIPPPTAAPDWRSLHTPSGKQMADAVLQLLPRHPAASAAARAWAEKSFSADRWLARHREIFESLLSASRPA